MKKTKQIGIFGGTFDPIHYGHLMVAQQASCNFNLDEVWFTPSYGNSNHKQNVTSFTHRMVMLGIALAEFEKFNVCCLEYSIGNFKQKTCVDKNVYTIELMNRLAIIYPQHEFHIILGSDTYKTLHSWYNYKELSKWTKIVIPRSTNPPIYASSTYIRDNIKSNECSEYMHEDVLDYIKSNGLYLKK